MSAGFNDRIAAVARAIHADWRETEPLSAAWDVLPEWLRVSGEVSKQTFVAKARQFVIALDTLNAFDAEAARAAGAGV